MNARGTSMFPLISTGDRIIVSPVKEYAVGDIVVFRRNDALVCHRLVRFFERDGTRCGQTRGDSFLNPDEPVPVERILGKVIMIERGGLSFPRRVLLLIFPSLRFGTLNAVVFSALVRMQGTFRRFAEFMTADNARNCSGVGSRRRRCARTPPSCPVTARA